MRDTFARVVAEGFRADEVVGASAEEIDGVARAQRASGVPAALREVLRLMGREPGMWLSGSSFGGVLDGESKRDALDCLDEHDAARLGSGDEGGHGMVDAEGMLVVLDAAGSSYLVVDGAASASSIHRCGPSPRGPVALAAGAREERPRS
ncbi:MULTISPECIES: hypothetical protein [Actinosynnema]|uniref:hypothetical protein n=1 Tax=Actinosynnema TaxID=40566 RepID=UPI0020A541A0|nr:hypothetical protein [Actinosynnema pretiosum]